MTKLSVNLNKVALIRNARGGDIPNLRRAAEACVAAGADGITLHPRSDGRHARAEDVVAMAAWLPVELNVEGNPFVGPAQTTGYSFPGFMEIVRQARPAQVTLVPDASDQLTSDHGWQLDDATSARLRPVIAELKAQGSRVSLFMDPVMVQIERASAIGADRVELFTGPYADAFSLGQAEELLPSYVAAASAASRGGIGLNAGHDLNLENLGRFLASVQNVKEVSIGQALVAEALHIGLGAAVHAYRSVIDTAVTFPK